MSQPQDPKPRRKSRRVHTKSRNGCKQCKRRHIKCDEQHPSCVNCSTAQLGCSYLDDNNLGQTTSSPRESQLGKTTKNPNTQVHRALNLDHLLFLHHFEMDLMLHPDTRLVADMTNASRLSKAIIESALSAPYLMDQVLAFSALHLSVVSCDAEKKQQYHHQALELQTKALEYFNTALPDHPKTQNGTAAFFFSSFLRMHMLFDMCATRDVVDSLDRFVRFLDLHRNVRTIFQTQWDTIRDTEMRFIIDAVEASEKEHWKLQDVDDVYKRLKELITTSRDSVGEGEFKAVNSAVDCLQWVQNQTQTLPEPLNLHIILAWPILISGEYIEMLRQRSPEALAILAHWAHLLHQGRQFWVFGNAGLHLIKSISRHVEHVMG